MKTVRKRFLIHDEAKHRRFGYCLKQCSRLWILSCCLPSSSDYLGENLNTNKVTASSRLTKTYITSIHTKKQFTRTYNLLKNEKGNKVLSKMINQFLVIRNQGYQLHGFSSSTKNHTGCRFVLYYALLHPCCSLFETQLRLCYIFFFLINLFSYHLFASFCIHFQSLCNLV